MATLAIGIVGGDMPWPLVVVGICFGIALIMMQVKSPMLVAVGMYLPFETTFAIFIGGVFRVARRLDGEASRLERGANGASRKCWGAYCFRLDRWGSHLWAALGRGHRIVVCPATVAAPGLGVGIENQDGADLCPSPLSEWNRRDGSAGRLDDLHAAVERRAIRTNRRPRRP